MWQANQLSLQKHLSESDISTFLEWSTIQATMYVGQAPYIQKELDAVLEFYPSEILEPITKEPTTYNGLSTNLIHQAYHLLQLESNGVRVKDLDSIIEFGGGYGAMALIVYRLGFTGDYCIYDLPELEPIQDYYLGLADIKASHSGGEADLLIAIHSLSEVDENLKRWRFLHQHPASYYLFAFHQSHLKWFKCLQKKRDDLDWLHSSIEHIRTQEYLVGI